MEERMNSVARSELKSPGTGSAVASGLCHEGINSEEQTGKYRAALRSSFRLCTSPGKDVAQQNPLRSSLPGGPRPSWLSLPAPQHSADRKPTLCDLQQPSPELPRCLQQWPVRHRPQPPAESWEMAHTSGSERQGSAHFASALAYRPRSNAQAA